jgi:hypothetical protein
VKEFDFKSMQKTIPNPVELKITHRMVRGTYSINLASGASADQTVTWGFPLKVLQYRIKLISTGGSYPDLTPVYLVGWIFNGNPGPIGMVIRQINFSSGTITLGVVWAVWGYQ